MRSPRHRVRSRLRLTLAFAAGLAAVLAAVSAADYMRTDAQQLDAADASLDARADALEVALRVDDAALERVDNRLNLSEDAFAQVVSRSGAVLHATASVATFAVVDRPTLRSVRERVYVERWVPGMEDDARILIDPLETPGRPLLVVGISLGDRADALVQLLLVLAVADPLVLALTSLAFWRVTGRLLRPVERMRLEAAAERRLVEDASHELRIPLATLKAELDLALRRRRSRPELVAAIRRAADETDRVVRLAHDLLVLSRANQGRLPVVRRSTSMERLLAAARERHLARARAAAVGIEISAPPGRALIDCERAGQVLDNLLDNALRHTPSGGRIRVTASLREGAVELTVADSGPGFGAGLAGRAFEPFARGPAGDGAGLGLTIVRAIAEGHGGAARAENRPEGGARVTVTLSESG